MSAKRRRGYREAQADAARGAVSCPHCNTWFVPLHDTARSATAVPSGPGLPDRPADQRAARAADMGERHERLHAELRRSVTDSTYHLWLAPLRLVDAAGTTLFVTAPAEIATWVADRFGRVLDEAATRLAGRPVTVAVVAIGSAS